MTFEQYIPLAFRTHNHLGSRRKNLAHMGLGIANEYLELQLSTGNENLAEELGDLLWFTACAIKLLDSKDRNSIDEHILKYRMQAIKVFTMTNLNESCEAAVNLIKKHYAYHIPIVNWNTWHGKIYMNYLIWRKKKFITNQALVQSLTEIAMCVVCLSWTNSLDFSAVMEGNIAKLKKRYPKGYTDYHAAERLDKNENKKHQSADIKVG